MKLRNKVLIGALAGLAVISLPTAVAITATSCGSSKPSKKPALPVMLNDAEFIQLVKRSTGIQEFDTIEGSEMVLKIKEPSVVKRLIAGLRWNNIVSNTNASWTDPSQDIVPDISATSVGTDVNVTIGGVPNQDNVPQVLKCTLTGFMVPTPPPAGYEINDWIAGDQFTKNGLKYEVIWNPKRYDWESQPKLALKIVDADLATAKLDQLADDVTTGKVTTTDPDKGDLCLPLMEIASYSINKIEGGHGEWNTIGDGSAISIIVPDTVISVGDAVFYHISNPITDFHLSTRLENASNFAFSGIKYYGQLLLPTTLQTLGSATFSNSCWTGEINIPSGVKEIPWSCFSWNSFVSGVTIAEGVEIIRGYAFYVTAFNKNVFFPNSVKVIEDYCFGGAIKPPVITVSYANGASINLERQEKKYTYTMR